MRPLTDSPKIQHIYEALIPYDLKYPYLTISEEGNVEEKDEILEPKTDDADQEGEGEAVAEEIDLVTRYKPRPTIILDQSSDPKTFLVLPLTKVDTEKLNTSSGYRNYYREVIRDKIKDRHRLSPKIYDGILKYESFVLIDSIQVVTPNNILYRRGFLKKNDYKAIIAKLKEVLLRQYRE